ncbi:MAG: metal-sensitive transcriptional regulator [Spirochaetales bacterium]|nr:metal-sensitive transcriptional regulator [Spirochaetales bacterium]
MLNDELKTQIANRLTRIQGQLGGIRKMVDEDRYCMDILVQTRAISAALKAVEDLVMENHLNTCVSDAMQNPNPHEKEEKIGELMEIISKFRKG